MKRVYIVSGILILLLSSFAFCQEETNDEIKSQAIDNNQEDGEVEQEESPLVFEAGATAQFLTEIFQSAMPIIREFGHEIKFENIKTGMTIIEQANISIQPIENPFVEVEVPEDNDDDKDKKEDKDKDKDEDKDSNKKEKADQDADQDSQSDTQKKQKKMIKQKLVKLSALQNIAKVSLCSEEQGIYLTLNNIRISGNSTLTIVVGIGNADRHQVNFAGTLKSVTIGYSIKSKKFQYFDFQFIQQSLSIGFLSEMEILDRKQLEDSSIKLLTENKQILIDELKPKINEIIFQKLKQGAGMIISMQQGYENNPLGFKITQTEVLMLIQNLLPTIQVSEDSTYLRHQKTFKSTSDNQIIVANIQTPTTQPPNVSIFNHGAWLTFHESIPNNKLYPLFYSGDKKDKNDDAYFFDLYNIMKNVGFSHLATVSNAGLLLPKLLEDFPDDKGAPISLTCSLNQSELAKVMKQIKRPQMKFKESNILLRFGVTCSIKVKVSKKIANPQAKKTIDEFDDDYVENLDNERPTNSTETTKTQTKPDKQEPKQVATKQSEWQNYRSIFCQPVIKLKAKINAKKAQKQEKKAQEGQEMKEQKAPETEIKIRDLDLGKITLIDKDGTHLQSEENMLDAIIAFGKNMLLGQINGFLKNTFSKSMNSSRESGKKNCFPLDFERFIYDTIKGWFYIGVDVKSMMDNEEDLIISDCVESTLGKFKSKLGDIEKQKSNPGMFANLFKSFAGR